MLAHVLLLEVNLLLIRVPTTLIWASMTVLITQVDHFAQAG